jgi:hypothetical protein
LHETIDVHETDEAAAWGEVERNDTAYYVYEEGSGEWNTLFVFTSLHID